MRWSTVATFAALALLVSAIPLAGAQAEPDQAAERTRVIVQLDPAGPASRAFSDDIVSRFGGKRSFVFEHAVSGFVAELPAAAIQALENNPNVVRITPDRVVVQLQAQDIPTGWDRIEADQAPAAPTGGACPQGEICTDVDIAVLDTGVNAHPDLNVVARTDCSGIIFPNTGQCADGTGFDGNSHGTHVAGSAAAFDNDFGVVGVAPGARVHSVKVLGDAGTGYLGGIIAGVDWVTARADVIDVVNMSLSGEFSDQTFDAAIANSVAAGVVYAVAAGNSSRDAAVESPANHPDVIATSAVADADGGAGGLSGFTCREGETDDTLATFSNFGSVVDIAAPGVCILSTGNDGGYNVKSGTSMASPHVAGAAARYIAMYGRDLNGSGTVDKADVDAVRAALIGDAHPQGTPCGFTGDPDAYPEPMLFVNGPAFGGNAVCDQGEVDPTPALPPGSLTAQADGYPIHLEWTAGSDPESGIREHRIYRDTDPSSGEILIGTTSATGVTYTDTQTAPGTTYTYTVTAVNLQFGESVRSGSAQATTSADDPTDAGWWAYEDQATTSASDTTAWRRSATLQNGTAWVPEAKIAGGVTLDGVDDRIDLDPNILDGAGDISFATWFRTTKTGTQTIISGANPGNDNEYTIDFANDTTLRFYSGASANAGATWNLPKSIADGEWHHLVVRRINGLSHVWAYIDGVSVGGWLITIQMVPVEIDGLVLGQDQDGVLSGFQSAEAFQGDLDETRLFTRVLTQDEINTLSGRDLTEPGAPPSLTATTVGHDVDLTWTPATDPESGIATYRISRDDGAGGPLARLTEVPGTATSYRDTAVAGSATYTYHVTAINGSDLEGSASPTDSATTPAADPTLRGWWSLDDGSGGTANDGTPNGNDGMLANGPTWTIDGRIAGALSFDGNDDRVDLDSTILDGATDVTAAMWVRTTNTGIQALISGANAGNDAEYEWFLLSNPDLRIRFYTGETSSSFVWWPTPTVADGEWHHVAATRDAAGDIIELFVDGLSQGTRSAVLNPLQIDAGGLMLGQDQDVVGGGFDPTQAFTGSLDEVRIYDRLLSSDEIGVLAGLAPAPPTNTSPTLDPIGPQAGDELSTISFAATATDPDSGQTLTFSLAGSVPNGAAIDSTGGGFTWTPSEAQGPGVFTFDVVVTDNGTPVMSDSQAVTVTVGEVDTSPVLAPIGNKTIDETVELSFTATATDADLPTQTITYSLGPGAPAGASIDPGNGTFTWTPTEAEGPGTYAVEVIASDGTAAAPANETISITVGEVDSPPVLDPIGNRSGSEGNEINFTATASDPDVPGQTLTFSLVGEPAGADIHPASGVFTWTPSEAQAPGDHTFDVVVTDDTALFDSEQITVTVTDTNSAPMLDDIAPITADELTQIMFTANATDPDLPSQDITYSLGAGAPPNASIDPVFGLFTWTPSEAEGPDVYTIEVIATDDGTPQLSDSTMVTVTVAEANTHPSLNPIADQTTTEGSLVSLAASASDTDLPTQSITYTLGVGAPSGSSIEPSTGSFTWQTSEADGPGSYDITVIATDDGPGNLTDTQTFTVTVTEVNTAPSLNPIADQTIAEGNLLTFEATATDPDLPLQVITYSLATPAPSGASIDALTGDFTWTPTETDGPGTFDITVIATDNGPGNLTDTQTFAVTVTEVNTAPILASVGNRSGDEQTPITFVVSATDDDVPGQQLTFSLSGAPAGASIDPTTGAFTWTPTEAQGPAGYTFDVIVTDDGTPNLADSETITISVQETNQAPIADAGPDQSATVGTTVTLDGSGSGDPDEPAQTLAFTWSIQTAATGSTATLDNATGVAPSFTPDIAGSYVVLLTVGDGEATTTDTVTVTATNVATSTDVAVAETTTYGSVVGGDLTATHEIGGTTETLEEEVTTGNPRNRMSLLEHSWTFDIGSGDTSTVAVSASASNNPDGDRFTFAYSVDGGQSFADIVTIGNGVTGGEAVLPQGTSGEVIVRVTDTDRLPGNSGADTVAVDAIVITTTSPGPALPEITVAASDPSASEDGDVGSFTFSRDAVDTALTVAYDIGGTATGGADYASLSGTVDFPAGVSQVVVDVVPMDDSVLDEGDEIVSVTLTPGLGYDIGAQSSAIVTIADNDVTGGGGGEFRASSEQSTFGAVSSGDYMKTFDGDLDFESITEEWYTGQNRTRLEHTWSITGISGSTATLVIDAHSTGEDFVFEISLDDGNTWVVEPSEAFSLGGATTLLVRVVDTNRNKGDTVRDTIHVDHILLTTS